MQYRPLLAIVGRVHQNQGQLPCSFSIIQERSEPCLPAWGERQIQCGMVFPPPCPIRNHPLVSFGFALSLSLFFFFRATPTAYGGSQARGIITATETAYTTATETSDLSRVCNLYHSSRQCRILNPLSKTRNGTHNLTVPIQIHFTAPQRELLSFGFEFK